MARFTGGAIMKRVMCINAGPLPGDVVNQPKLNEGSCYTVKRETIGIDFKEYRGTCYALNEIYDFYVYQKERFIECSDVDEAELVNEKEGVLQEK